MDNSDIHHALRDSQNRMKIMAEVELTKAMERAGSTIRNIQKATTYSVDDLSEQVEKARKDYDKNKKDIVKIQKDLNDRFNNFKNRLKSNQKEIIKDLAAKKLQDAKQKSIKRTEESIERAELIIEDMIYSFMHAEVAILEALLTLKQAEDIVFK